MTSTEITTTNTLTKAELREIAGRIRGRTAQAIIENGHDLLKAKAALPHGKFTAWVEEWVAMSERTAQRCMQVAEWAAGLPEDKTDTVTVLPPRQLYILSGCTTPKRAQERALSQLEISGRIEQSWLLKIVREERAEEARMRGDWREADRIRGIRSAETAVTGDGGEGLVEPPEAREKPGEDEPEGAAAGARARTLDDQPKPRKPSVDLGRTGEEVSIETAWDHFKEPATSRADGIKKIREVRAFAAYVAADAKRAAQEEEAEKRSKVALRNATPEEAREIYIEWLVKQPKETRVEEVRHLHEVAKVSTRDFISPTWNRIGGKS